MGNEKRKPNTPEVLIAGGVGGMSYWCFTFPLDTIKTLYQSDSFKKPKYTNLVQAFRREIRLQGWKGLYNGYSTCLLRSLPANMGTFLGFELCMGVIGGYN